MYMMAAFFDITKNSKEMLKNTKITETECGSKMNQYPTVFIPFANVKSKTVFMYTTSFIQEIRT